EGDIHIGSIHIRIRIRRTHAPVTGVHWAGASSGRRSATRCSTVPRMAPMSETVTTTTVTSEAPSGGTLPSALPAVLKVPPNCRHLLRRAHLLSSTSCGDGGNNGSGAGNANGTLTHSS